MSNVRLNLIVLLAIETIGGHTQIVFLWEMVKKFASFVRFCDSLLVAMVAILDKKLPLCGVLGTYYRLLGGHPRNFPEHFGFPHFPGWHDI